MPEFLTCTVCGLLDDGLGPFGDPEESCQCPRCPDCNQYRCEHYPEPEDANV